MIGVGIATVIGLVKKSKISMARWAALGAALLILVAGDLGDDFWQRVFIERMSASLHAGSLMIAAAYRGNLPLVRSYLAHGIPITAVERHDGRTVLHAAAVSGDKDLIQFLAANGAQLDAMDRYGDSPLEVALEHGNGRSAKALEQLGAKRIRGDQAQRDKAIHDQVRETSDAINSR